MTVKDMRIGVQLGVDKVGSFSLDGLLQGEIEYYLNKALREFIRRQSIYLRKSLKNLSREDFISDSDALINLYPIIETHSYSILNDSTNYDNAKKAPLSDLGNDMYSYIYSQVKTSLDSGFRECKLISLSEIGKYSKTEYNAPVFRKCPIIITSSDLVIFYDAREEDIVSCELTYLRSPKKLVETSPSETEVTTCELPNSTHDEIVDIAVGMITEDIKSARPYEQNQTTIKPDN